MADRVVSYRLTADITAFKAQMAQASSSVKSAANEMTAATKEGARFREGLDSAGRAAGMVGLAAAAGVGAAVVTAANFEQAMSSVEAATRASTGELEALRDAAIKAGADTAFSASEAAAGIENLAKAGVSTRDILAGGLTGALDLAAAGTLEVGQAAEIAAVALTQFNLQGQDIPKVADLLAAGAGKAQGEVTDLAAALNQSGLVASQLGLSLEETVGGLSAFASAGLLGSDAGTSFKTMLSSLVPKSEEAAKAMEANGISAFDAQGNFIGLAAVAENLRTSLDEMSVAQRQATLQTIFGSDAIRAANVLYNQGGAGIEEWITKVDDAGFASETAATKLDNLKGDLEAFSGSLETLLIKMGEGGQDPFRGLVQGATDAVNAFSGLPKPVLGATTALLALTAVTGGSLWFGAKVIGGIANTREALSNLSGQAVSTRQVLTGVGKAFAVTGALFAISAVDDALDSLLDADLAGSQLQRSLSALANGDITGTIADVWGSDLAGLNRDLDTLDNNLARVTDFPDKFLPGDLTNTQQAQSNIKQLDEALASLVESGQQQVAGDVFKQLAAAAEEGGNSVGQLQELLPQYAIALKNIGTESENSADSSKQFASSSELVAQALKQEKEAAREAADAMRERREEALRAFNADLNYQEALLDAQKAAKNFNDVLGKNGQLLDGQKRKGIEAKRELAALAGAWNEQSEASQNARGAYRQAREALIQTAEQMGLSREAAKRYADQLLEIPTRRTTKVEITGNAAAELAAIRARMDAIKDKTVTVTVNSRRIGGQAPTADGMATGGPVIGPGTATSDSIPAWLSNGEYVVRAAAVQRYGTHFFEQLNAMRLSSGGQVGQGASSGPLTATISERDMDRLAEKVRAGAAAGVENRNRGAYMGSRV